MVSQKSQQDKSAASQKRTPKNHATQNHPCPNQPYRAAGALKLENVQIAEGDQPVVALNAQIEPGQVLTLMGPSGSGKSTLINAISGFLPQDFTCRGHIFLGDTDVTMLPPEQRRIGVLFQDALLFPHFSVLENVQYAVPSSIVGAKRTENARALLDAVGLDDFRDRDPANLSGGQKARVALVRVLASQPLALLLDEPFAKLDTELRDSVRQLVFDEVHNRNLPTLLVTHDIADAQAANGIVTEL